jgi:hypothetical protein
MKARRTRTYPAWDAYERRPELASPAHEKAVLHAALRLVDHWLAGERRADLEDDLAKAVLGYYQTVARE